MKGEVLSKNANLVKAELRKQGITSDRGRAQAQAAVSARAGKRITAREIAIFSRQLATMMQSGVPMVQSFEIIAGGQKNPRMKDLMLETSRKTEVESGSSLYESLAKHPVQFDELYRNLVKAGEVGGRARHRAGHDRQLQGKHREPEGQDQEGAVLSGRPWSRSRSGVSAILLIFVVPQFEDMFSSFGADLPAFTKMIVARLRLHGRLLVAGAAGIVVGIIIA